jgi:hypothetical protein
LLAAITAKKADIRYALKHFFRLWELMQRKHLYLDCSSNPKFKAIYEYGTKNITIHTF